MGNRRQNIVGVSVVDTSRSRRKYDSKHWRQSIVGLSVLDTSWRE